MPGHDQKMTIRNISTNSSSNNKSSRIRNIVVNITSTVAAVCITQPLDTVTIRMQTRNLSIKNATKQLFKTNGFFRGLSWNLSIKGTFWSIYFACNENLPFPMFVNSLIGSIGGAIAVNPMAVWKQNRQNNIKNCNVFAGLKTSCIRNAQLIFLYPLMQYIKPYFPASVEYPASKFLLNLVSYPLAVIMVSQRESINKISMHKCTYTLWTNGGIRRFYKGFWPYTTLSIVQFWGIGLFKDILKYKN